MAFDRLLARFFLSRGVPWVLKGGYAMELRFDGARATKDLDFTAAASAGDRLIQTLQDAAAVDLEDFFTYTVGETTQVLDGAPYGGVRPPVECVMDGRVFSHFHIDVGVGDVIMEPTESIQCRNWLEFALIVAPVVKAVCREQQFTEKLHSYTLPRPTSNSRVRDLVDMVLLIQSASLATKAVVEAMAMTFESRGTHAAPDELPEPAQEWAAPFGLMAKECKLELDAAGAFGVLRKFYASLR